MKLDHLEPLFVKVRAAKAACRLADDAAKAATEAQRDASNTLWDARAALNEALGDLESEPTS